MWALVFTIINIWFHKSQGFYFSADQLRAFERRVAPWNMFPHFYVKMKPGFRSVKGHARERS
jgi:hypothetical protein